MTKLVLILTIGAYLSLMLSRAATNSPYVDEATYILPAWNMATHGSFGTPVIEPSSSSNPLMTISHAGIREHTYWVMPLFPLSEAVWIRMFEFSILRVRLLVILSGFGLLAAWYAIVLRLSGGNHKLATLAVALIAIDTTFIVTATIARPDMLAAAAGYSGVAAYLLLREKSLSLAVLAANACIAVAALVQPNAGIVCFGVLLATVLMTDRAQLTFGMLLPTVVPYAVIAAGWMWYIAQDPTAFRSQFFSNATQRVTPFSHPFDTLHREVLRYVSAYGFGSLSVYAWLRMFPLLFYVALFLLGALTFRQRSTACQRLIVMSCIAALILGAIDNTRMRFYLMLTVPVLIAAAAAVYVETLQRIPRYAVGGIAACLLLLSPLNVLRLAIRDHEENLYGKTIEFIKTNTDPNQLVMGSAELFFGLGPDRLIDDIWLGYYSGLEPQVIVIGPPADGRDVLTLPSDGEAVRHVRSLREHKFHAAYSNRLYTVYLPTSAQ